MKQLKKFKTSWAGMGILVLGDVIAFGLYICCLYAAKAGIDNIALNIVTNILLVLLSVLTTSIISVPLIEVRGKNTLCQQMLAKDVLCTPQVYKALPEQQKAEMLKGLEAEVYFDDNMVKEDMYASIRKKMQGPEEDYYFTSCEYIVRCYVERDLIRKNVLKKISLRSYKPVTIPDFPLCVTAFPEIEGEEYLRVSSLTVNGNECEVKDAVRSEKSKLHDALSKKSGYTTKMQHFYNRTLSLSPDRTAVIVVEYTTVVPQNDKSYICRISAPCQKFKFQFFMDGENKDQYQAVLSAFGFIDEGSKAAVPHDDMTFVSTELNDWIFPGDGVVINIMERAPAPAATPVPALGE